MSAMVSVSNYPTWDNHDYRTPTGYRRVMMEAHWTSLDGTIYTVSVISRWDQISFQVRLVRSPSDQPMPKPTRILHETIVDEDGIAGMVAHYKTNLVSYVVEEML